MFLLHHHLWSGSFDLNHYTTLTVSTILTSTIIEPRLLLVKLLSNWGAYKIVSLNSQVDK
jgi:hypothetical protein